MLEQHWEPQPDLVLLKPRQDFYTSALPGPEDALLVVEIADASAPAAFPEVELSVDEILG